MKLKAIFDKTAFVKFMISNNFKQNIDETHSKQTKIHRKIHTAYGFLKPKVSRLLPKVCEFRKEIYNLWYGFKIYR